MQLLGPRGGAEELLAGFDLAGSEGVEMLVVGVAAGLAAALVDFCYGWGGGGVLAGAFISQTCVFG